MSKPVKRGRIDYLLSEGAYFLLKSVERSVQLPGIADSVKDALEHEIVRTYPRNWKRRMPERYVKALEGVIEAVEKRKGVTA